MSFCFYLLSVLLPHRSALSFSWWTLMSYKCLWTYYFFLQYQPQKGKTTSVFRRQTARTFTHVPPPLRMPLPSLSLPRLFIPVMTPAGQVTRRHEPKSDTSETSESGLAGFAPLRRPPSHRTSMPQTWTSASVRSRCWDVQAGLVQ